MKLYILSEQTLIEKK